MDPHQLEKLLSDAVHLATKYRNYYTTREHVLYQLLQTKEVKQVFKDLNLPIDFVQTQLEKYFQETLERAADGEKSELAALTESVKQMTGQVVMHALSSNRPFPREVDFLIFLASDSTSFAAALFKTIGLKSLELMRWATEHPVSNYVSIDIQMPDFVQMSESDEMEDGMEEDPIELGYDDDESDDSDDGDKSSDDGENPALFARIKPYVTRLVRLARAGKIDPVVGRDKEIRTCCQALLRRQKCNVLILGDAGVGKTAIVEGLARAIANGEVPGDLYHSEIYSVDIPSLMAGTKYRGEMESRLKSILQYVKKRSNAILFIDELHSAAGTDKSNGSQEILTLLKPELAKGHIRLIGTTTYEDFRRVLSNDSALLRRFHKLDIEEPDEPTTKRIIKTLSSHYSDFHQVSYTDEALDAAVTLSGRYLPERHFPDKAIDVIDEAGAANRMLPVGEQKTSLDIEDIEKIVTNIARIPDIRVTADESSMLKDAEDKLKTVVFGQDKAISTVVRLVKLSRAGIRDAQKPVANLLFTGPTGVGKTEVARQLARILSVPFVRFDMSEYREEYTISKFIGSAPGYVGYERGGLLTEAIRSKPNCVLLLDEIEKAHPSIYDLLLQVMDVARLTDNNGKTADFRNVILIMTSNAGGEEINRVRIGFDSEIDVSRGQKEIEKTFSPEFRNRLDEIVMFEALTQDSMKLIVQKFVHQLESQLAEKNIHISLSDEACLWLSEHGYDKCFGARPMARLVQNEISVPLADEILFGALKNGGEVEITVKSDNSGLHITSHS